MRTWLRPLNTIKGQSFVDFCEALNPNYQVPCSTEFEDCKSQLKIKTTVDSMCCSNYWHVDKCCHGRVGLFHRNSTLSNSTLVTWIVLCTNSFIFSIRHYWIFLAYPRWLFLYPVPPTPAPSPLPLRPAPPPPPPPPAPGIRVPQFQKTATQHHWRRY